MRGATLAATRAAWGYNRAVCKRTISHPQRAWVPAAAAAASTELAQPGEGGPGTRVMYVLRRALPQPCASSIADSSRRAAAVQACFSGPSARSSRPACACASSSQLRSPPRSTALLLPFQLRTPASLLSKRRRNLAQRVECMQQASDLPANLAKIVTTFQIVPDPMARYKQLLFYATKLEPLPAEDHTPENKVQGCVSQVWVKPQLREDGCIYWQADSDSQLTKGLAALLVNGLSGCTPKEILTVEPTFIELLGLKQSLTPSRNNGFLNMFLLMKKKALQLAVAEVAAGGGADGAGSTAPGA